ncbi:hypothetical protein [Wolbachia endosymbiont of Ctenocephalides felis wCfeJ]|uniref:hypothetical protein n=1 Tax=Wolbachia endosymbiont of Ctenocephalides felis wCfeJ TaxID=2732594 RepID=UPI001FE9A597|nr:hypothetical protein [Wolbachia endosymbiont of Ctenocephalides felis wCfeJ]
MKVNLSKKNSERVLSSTKWIANAGQNYLASLNDSTKPISSWKKLINAVLLVPIIIPTAATVASIICTYFFLNAVSIQKDDTKLSKTAKFIARILIYVIAAIILIPCIMSNIVASLIPALIFYWINRDFFNQRDMNIEVNEVKATSKEEYNKCIKEEVSKLEQQDDADQGQPDIKVISQVIKGEQAIDRTVVARIADDDIEDGKGMIRTTANDQNVAMKGIIAGNLSSQKEGFAAGFGLQCSLVEDGVDLQFGFNARTGTDKKQAIECLKKSESARTLLSGDGGILSIEQYNSAQQK